MKTGLNYPDFLLFALDVGGYIPHNSCGTDDTAAPQIRAEEVSGKKRTIQA
jgi:hypothetical protein